jgi:alkyldihydroxyacetonephosphate synthase
VSEPQREIAIDPIIENHAFIEAIKGKVDEINTNKMTRIFHSHGHSLQELFLLRNSKLPRTADYVVYITTHEQAEQLIEAAKKHSVVLIPFGGGTNVTESLMCQPEEKRSIVSVDMTRMNKMIACIEAGIIGKDMEKELSKHGVMCGHEPDSVEFSSLGGWVSTRASGMKKNKYGNIDDIIISIKIATPIGTFQKVQNSPRVSSGPDIHEFILGHEGNFGIITECIVKIRHIPEKKVYESILFYDFDVGIKFMYDVSQSKVWPASLRLMDNQQFQFGMALKMEDKSKLHEYINSAKKYFITEVMGFDPNKMTLCTILFEGNAL